MSDPGLQSSVVSRLARWWPAALVAGALFALAGAKFKLIAYFGSDVPFGDQWLGELTTTYAPYLEGRFGWRELFAAHFEHRIVWGRLFDLGLLEANGRWDPRLQLLANVPIILAAVGLLLFRFVRDLPPLTAAVATGFSVLLFGSEILWENTLWGFQCSFSFLLFFSLAHVVLTSAARPWSPAWWLGHAAGLANLFSMAGGVLSAVAVLVWLGWRRWRCRERAPGAGFAAGWNVALVATSLLLWPSVGILRHGPARPSLLEIIHRALDVFSWPAMDWRVGLLMWAPALLFLLRLVFMPTRRFGPAWLMPVVLLMLFFCGAVVYARGGALASRYSDFYALGAFTNLVCALLWPAVGRLAKLKLFFVLLWIFLLITALVRREQNVYFYTLQKDIVTRQTEADRIRHFFRTGETVLLKAFPAFDGDQIFAFELVRDSPALQTIMPLSLRAPLAVAPAQNSLNRGFTSEQLPLLPGLPVAFPAWGSYDAGLDAQWTSAPLTAHQPILVFYVAGEIKTPLTTLNLVTVDGRTVPPLKAEVRATEKWIRLNFANPGQSFQIQARDTDPAAAFAFSAPLEQTRASWLVPKILGSWSALQVAGWLLFIAGAAVPLMGWIRATD